MIYPPDGHPCSQPCEGYPPPAWAYCVFAFVVFVVWPLTVIFDALART